MNNWRLPLLALVAVFQPISSFTERNLVDGRHQCCDRQSPTLFRDTRSSLHGTTQLGKTSSAFQRLNDRDEIREVRRYELRQRDSIFTRPSTERPLREIQERVTRQGPSAVARSYRVEQRRERIADDQNRDRETTARNIRDVKPEYQIRRVVDRNSKDALERRDGRANIESRRNLFRDDNRDNRFSNERLSKNMYNSELEMRREQFRSGELRLTRNKDVRDVIRQTRDDVVREASHYLSNRQQIAREKLSVVRRETLVRATRSVENNNERRELERHNEERRSLSENTRLVDRIREVRNRQNSREENGEHRRNIAHERLTTERFDERRQQRQDYMESRQQNKENTDRRLSLERIQMARTTVGDRREIKSNEGMTRQTRYEIRENTDGRLSVKRIQMDRKNSRESRIMKALNERDADSRREIRKNYEMTREIRNEIRENPDHRLSRERIQVNRRNSRETRIMNILNERDVNSRREIRHHERISRDTAVIRENRASHERIQMVRRNIQGFRVLNSMITQNDRDIDSRREISYNNRMSRDTRDEIRENPEYRLSRERIQIDRKNIRESRIMNTNERAADSRGEIRHHERISRDTRDERENRLSHERITGREISYTNRMLRDTSDEIRENPDRRLSRERIQMNQRNIREFRYMNTITGNNRDVDSRLEIRSNERLSTENRETSNRDVSRETIEMERKNTRESRNMNRLNDREVDSRREIRNNELFRQTRDGIREHRDQIVSRERIQMERNTPEYRFKNTHNEQNIDSRREIRHNKRSSEEARNEIRENLAQRLARESRQMNRRNIRESRIINDMATRNERDTRYNERLSRHIRDNQERRLESRSLGRVNIVERDNLVTDRRARSVDRRNIRELRVEPKLSRSADLERRSDVFRSQVEHRNIIETRERETTDARFRNVDLVRNRERTSTVMVGKMEPENDTMVSNWQYVLYTLQGAYLCALFMQMLTPSRTEKAHKMNLRWLSSSHYNPIKVD